MEMQIVDVVQETEAAPVSEDKANVDIEAKDTNNVE